MRSQTTKLFALLGLLCALVSSGMVQRGSAPPLLPDVSKTPGDTLDVTRDDICVAGYTKTVRNVPTVIKEAVYASYGIGRRSPGEFEMDHLISLELGGSNSARNLWPQSYKTSPWNAHIKDRLENRLHADVCSGKIDLKAAQQDIARDWITCYKRTFGTNTPLTKSVKGHRLSKGVGRAASASASTGQVWVNTRSGKYFRSGSRYYGKTKAGKYLSESEAKVQGYVPARGQ